MLYIIGDTHGDFYRFGHLGLNKDDIMIILGDVGINYYLDEYDKKLKERLKDIILNFSVFKVIMKRDQKIFLVTTKWKCLAVKYL